MRKFIILNYEYSQNNPMYITSIACSTTDIRDAILHDDRVLKSYENDENKRVIFLDSEEGKELVKQWINKYELENKNYAYQMRLNEEFLNKLK